MWFLPTDAQLEGLDSLPALLGSLHAGVNFPHLAAGRLARIVDKPPLIFHFTRKRDTRHHVDAEAMFASYRKCLSPERLGLFNRYTLDYVIVIILVLLVLFARLERSSLGRAMDSIHQDETAVEAMGIDVVRIKLLAFGLGAVIAGLAGALYAHHAPFMDSTTFNVMRGVEILMFVVVGGGSTFLGPLVGAAVLNAIPEILRALRDWLELIPVA